MLICFNFFLRYIVIIEIWQEDKDFELCILDECYILFFLLLIKNCEKKVWRCDEEIIIFLDSECEIERLFVEVIVV